MADQPVHILPDQAAVYVIQVYGQIDEYWQSYFDDFDIEIVGEGRTALTTITGRLMDQAALQGILQHLYGLGLVLLHVKRKDERCSFQVCQPEGNPLYP